MMLKSYASELSGSDCALSKCAMHCHRREWRRRSDTRRSDPERPLVRNIAKRVGAVVTARKMSAIATEADELTRIFVTTVKNIKKRRR